MSETKVSEDVTPDEAKAVNLDINADELKNKCDPKESDEAIIEYLMTNPRTGKRMSYEESRMMYG